VRLGWIPRCGNARGTGTVEGVPVKILEGNVSILRRFPKQSAKGYLIGADGFLYWKEDKVTHTKIVGEVTDDLMRDVASCRDGKCLQNTN